MSNANADERQPPTVDQPLTEDEYAVIAAYRDARNTLRAIPTAWRFELDVDPNRVLGRIVPKVMREQADLKRLFTKLRGG